MATRLTNTLRREIFKKAENLAFATRRRELNAEKARLAMAIYAHEVGTDDVVTRTLAAKGWIEQDSHIPINCEAWSPRGAENFDVPTDHPHKATWKYGGGIEVGPNHKHYEDMRKLRAKWDKLEADKDAFKQNLRSVMSGVTTLEKLRERWPECDKVTEIETEPEVPKYEVVPVNLINDINKALGLEAHHG